MLAPPQPLPEREGLIDSFAVRMRSFPHKERRNWGMGGRINLLVELEFVDRFVNRRLRISAIQHDLLHDQPVDRIDK